MNEHEDMATQDEVAEYLREKEQIDNRIKWDWRKVYILYIVGAILLAWFIFAW